jgi:tripartite-type tricarboxylate transporter receptor subunit TctC
MRPLKSAMLKSVMLKSAVVTLCACAAFVVLALPAHAEQFPSRGIKIISPHPPGVATDILGRALAQKLSESLGVSVIVEDRPGANGIIAAGAVAKSDPDGYTILITSGSHVANAFTTKDLPFDVLKDFAPVTQLAASYGLALITNLPVSSVPQLVALAKSKPGQLTYATNGVGNITHIAGLLFDARNGTKMTPVPYNTPNLTNDVVAGTVDMTFFSAAGATPLVKAGKIKALAVTGPRRDPDLADVPTLQEQGYPDFDVTGYFGLLVPANTPRDRIDLIARESEKAMKSPDVQKFLSSSGMYSVDSGPQQFAAFLKKDYDYQDRLMAELGLKVQ